VASELTATLRTGIQRHSLPAGEGHLLIDLSHLVLDSSDFPPLIDAAALEWLPDGTLVGTRRVWRWAKGGRSISPCSSRARRRGSNSSATTTRLRPTMRGDQRQAVESRGLVPDAGAAPIVIRTGISAVDVAGARANLAAEAPHFDFDAYARAAETAWAGNWRASP
jgi:putative alpha-1,2-mannosidase